jgi:SAM-dependent methyltransferase
MKEQIQSKIKAIESSENLTSYEVLEIGSGKDKLEGAIGLDIHDYEETDIVFDLERIGEGEELPFESNRFEIVRAKQVFEHIENLIPVLEEIYRVMDEGAVLVAESPHYRRKTAYSDPTHERFFTGKTFSYFVNNTDTGIIEEQMDSQYQLFRNGLIYNYERGRAPNPFHFWKPETVRAVLVKEGNQNLEPEFVNSFPSSLLHRLR